MSMTLKEYNSFIRENLSRTVTKGDRMCASWSRETAEHIDENLYWPNGTSTYLDIEWESGGARGGNCWGNEAHEYSSDAEPDYSLLDSLLENLCSKLSFLQYRRLLKEVGERTTRCEAEYYGNYTLYNIHRFDFRKLYDFLSKEGLI